MNWILVLVFWYGYGTTNIAIEFKTEEACVTAGKKISGDTNASVSYSCVSKG